jgi:hypothetical protein
MILITEFGTQLAPAVERRLLSLEAAGGILLFGTSPLMHDPAGWVKALAMERETYKRRAKYQRRGVLGDLGIALLQLLLNLGRKYGKIFQDYGTLAVLLRKDPEAVVEAMKRLIAHGFVTKHRRSKLIGTPQGQRRVQDSNARGPHARAGTGGVAARCGPAFRFGKTSCICSPGPR